MSRRLRIAAAAALMVSALAVGLMTSSAAQAAPRDNLANARLCLRGGWHDLQTSRGRPFRGVAQCVVYALFGGKFAATDPGGSGDAGDGGSDGSGGGGGGE
jgi:hypothetical protein